MKEELTFLCNALFCNVRDLTMYEVSSLYRNYFLSSSWNKNTEQDKGNLVYISYQSDEKTLKLLLHFIVGYIIYMGSFQHENGEVATSATQ